MYILAHSNSIFFQICTHINNNVIFHGNLRICENVYYRKKDIKRGRMKDKYDGNTIEMSKIYNVLNTQNRLCYQQGIYSCLLCTVVSFRMDRTYNISKLQKLNLPSKEHTLPFYGCTGRIFLVLITNLRFFVVFMERYI